MTAEDNLDAAMAREAKHLEPGVPSATGASPGAPATKQVLVRAVPADHERWKAAAERLGVSMSEFIRGCCNDAAADLLDCSHPLNLRRYYPWAEFCLACGQRLRG
jgi:hypothetical protein